jgi:tetratricopeptide (TPR) repeat protein
MEKWALDNDATNLEALTELAFILISLHDPSAARAPLEKSVQLYPRFSWSYTSLAKIYTQAGEWDKAAEAYFHLYEYAAPDRKEAYLTAAIEAYTKAGQPEKARQMQALLDQK